MNTVSVLSALVEFAFGMLWATALALALTITSRWAWILEAK